MTTTPIAAGPVDVNVSHLSPDDLMRMNGYLAGCVSILIEACKTTAAGRKALCEWDKHRGTGANAIGNGRAGIIGTSR